jgi:hypothetical protein
MRREDAIKKLTKLLGKKLGYRVDPKAPDHDERANAREQLEGFRAERDRLRTQKELRLKAILAADEEYQRLKVELDAHSKRCDELIGITLQYRFTAGYFMAAGFFVIKAQGDSWEEVIAKLQKERVT